MKNRIALIPFGVLFAFFAWLLVYWGGAGQARPMMDAMTYGALAKHVLVTGDWARLHYSSEAYGDFFQHPPLAIWLQALVFKAFGASDLTIRFLPTVAAGLTLGLVYRLGMRAGGSWMGWVAFFVLLSSTRFVKYSLQFYLDPFMALFLVAGVNIFHAWLKLEPSSRSNRAGFAGVGVGLASALAFLAKGVPAVVLLFAVLLVCAESLRHPQKRSSTIRFWSGFLPGIAAPLALWVLWGGGGEYLLRYWQESVAGRATPRDWETASAPAGNLMKQYWPWLVVLPWALTRFFWREGLEGLFRSEGLPWLMAGGFFVGFSAAGMFLEHYLVPFYPFAAWGIARELAPVLERWKSSLAWGIGVMLLVYAGLLLGGLEVHGDAHRDAFRNVMKRGAELCPSVKRVTVSDELADRWRGLATALWYTPADAVVGPVSWNVELKNQAEGAVVSLNRWVEFAGENQDAHGGWTVLTQENGLVFAGTSGCR